MVALSSFQVREFMLVKSAVAAERSRVRMFGPYATYRTDGTRSIVSAARAVIRRRAPMWAPNSCPPMPLIPNSMPAMPSNAAGFLPVPA